MSIILFHSNTSLPNCIFHCIQKIKQYSKIPIYLLTDQNCNIKDVNIINILKYKNLNWLNELKYFNNDDYISKLFKNSCFRLFYIHQFLEENNIKHILHFDNDVLLYENPEKIIEKISSKYKNFCITAHNSSEVVFGMSYIEDSVSLSLIVNFIEQELKSSNLLKKYNGCPNEMQIISKINDINFLPILPDNISENRYTNNFKYFNSVFDPSSYGQFLGGTWTDKKPGWFGTHQEIGKFIENNKIKVLFENKNPYILYENTKIKINNLHIHSKQTELFL
jgi:hypothetical protein